MAAPAGRFRTGARSAPTYEVECELDHVISSVYALGSAFIAGTERDLAAQASRRLADLDRVASRLETTATSDVLRADWNAYVGATRAVLEAILAADMRNVPR